MLLGAARRRDAGLLEERSGEDVAAALGLTRGHVDVLVHRAKAALRICMRKPVGG